MVLKEISKILQGDSANFNDLSIPNYSPDILANFQYAPITSVDVECSCSSYKYILTDCRHNFTEINMEHTLTTYYFSN
jgi:hypothetical protein